SAPLIVHALPHRRVLSKTKSCRNSLWPEFPAATAKSNDPQCAGSPPGSVALNPSAEEEGRNNQVVPFKRAPPDPPPCPECCGNPRLLCRGTNSSNPPSSGESDELRYVGDRRPRHRRREWRPACVRRVPWPRRCSPTAWAD